MKKPYNSVGKWGGKQKICKLWFGEKSPYLIGC